MNLDAISAQDKLVMRFHDLEYLIHPKNPKIKVFRNPSEARSLYEDMTGEIGRCQTQKDILNAQMKLEEDALIVMGLLSGEQRLTSLIFKEEIDERLKAVDIYNRLPKERREGLIKGYQKPRKQPYEQIPNDRRQPLSMSVE